MAKSTLENTQFNDEYRFVYDSWILGFVDFSFFFRVISMQERRRISEQASIHCWQQQQQQQQQQRLVAIAARTW